MQIILSPAKLMDFSDKSDKIKTTKPQFEEKTAELAAICKKLTAEDIANIMNINAKMAYDVYEYFHTFDFKNTPERAAALAYNGIAYKGLNFHDFSDKEIRYATQHFNIISGLYGILRPTDVIKPYRLEMHRDIPLKDSANLYDYWHDTLETYLSKKLADDDNVLINLASNEYAKTVLTKKIKKQATVIQIKFLEQKGNALKQIVVYTKKARGLMTRFILKNQLTMPEEIKAFDYEGYLFDPSASKDNLWVFTR